MDAPAPTYMYTRIQLKRGRSRQFSENMGRLKDVMESEFGWRMVAGFTVTLGRIGDVVHIWQVPSANSVLSDLAQARTRADVAEWSEGFAESVEDEAFFLVTPMPYAPQTP